MMITQSRVKELFNYDPETGILTNKIARGNRRGKIGDEVGSITSHGYLDTTVAGKRCYIHRICFLHYHGFLPKSVDHRNTNKLDNKIKNLRAATVQENNCNKVEISTNTSGHRNVYWHKASSKWRVAVQKDGKSNHIGLYADKSVAINAAKEARSVFFGEFANND